MKKRLATVVVLSSFVIAPASVMAQMTTNTVSAAQFAVPEAGTFTRSFTFNYPNQVYRLRIYAADSTTLKISVADTGLPGDRWNVTAYIHDKTPAKKTTTCNGVVGKYSSVIVMKSGEVKPLQTLVEIRYTRGANVFPAGGYLNFEYDGTTAPTVTEIGLSDF